MQQNSTKAQNVVSETAIVDGAVPAVENPYATPTEGAEWYVMRVTYQRELVARRVLEGLGVECFVPTERVRKRKIGGGYRFQEVARLHNYIFIHTSPEILQQIKSRHIPHLRYLMARGDNGLPTKQFVPADQMENFMAICRSEQARLLDPMGGLRKGDRVRILVGPLRGVEGIYARTAARHEKCVVVEIEGVAAACTAAYTAAEVEKVE